MEAECSGSGSSGSASYTAEYSPPHQAHPWTAPTVLDHSLITLPAPTQYPGDLKSALVRKQEDDTTDWEDPELSWLGLVRAFQDKDPVSISRMLRLAKSSPHTTISFAAMLERGGFGLDVTYGRPGDHVPSSDSDDQPLFCDPPDFVYTQGDNPDEGVGASGIPLGD